MQYGHPERKQIKRSYDPQVHTWTNSMMFQFKQSPRGVRSRASWLGCVVLPITGPSCSCFRLFRRVG